LILTETIGVICGQSTKIGLKKLETLLYRTVQVHGQTDGQMSIAIAHCNRVDQRYALSGSQCIMQFLFVPPYIWYSAKRDAAAAIQR